MTSTMRFDKWENPTSTKSVTMDQIAGGSGLVPITPTSVTVGSGTSSIASNGIVTFSGASYIRLDNIFTSAYSAYRILVSHNSATQGNFYFRYISSSNAVTTGYYYVGQYVTMAGTVALWGGSNAAQIETGKIHATAGLSGFIMDVANPYEAIATRCLWNSHGDNGSTIFTVNGAAHLYSPTQMQGVYLFPGGGTASGTFQIYGYR